MDTLGHQAPISSISSYDVSRVLTSGYDNQLILWDNNFNIIDKAMHDHLVNQAEFSRCGKLIASCSSDYSVRVWSTEGLVRILTINHHIDDVEMVRFSPSGTLLASCSRDNSVAVFDLESGALLVEFLGHSADVLSVDWIDDQLLVSCGDDGSIRYWSLEQKEELSKITFDGLETDTLVVVSESLVIAGNDDGNICILKEGVIFESIKAHASGIKRLVYSSELNQLISISYDRKISFWAVVGSNIEFLSQADIPSYVWPRSCCFIDEASVGFATFASHYSILDIKTNKWNSSQYKWSKSLNAIFIESRDVYTIGDSGTLCKNNESLVCVNSLCNFLTVISNRDETHIYFGGQEGIIWHYNEESRALNVLIQHVAPINAGLIYSDQYLIAADYNGQLVIIDLRDNSHRTLEVFKHAIKSLSSDLDNLFMVSADCKAASLNLKNMKVFDVGVAHDKIANGCVANNGSYYSVSRDLKMRKFSDVLELELEIETPHKNSIKCVSISTDGSILASGSYGGEVALYTCLKDEVRLVKVYRPTTWGISCLAFSLQNNSFFASSYDGNVYELSCLGGDV